MHAVSTNLEDVAAVLLGMTAGLPNKGWLENSLNSCVEWPWKAEILHQINTGAFRISFR